MSDLDALLDPRTIRQRARRVWDRAIDGGTAFRVDVDRLPACVELVLDVTRRAYPDGRIPYHGRFEHFRAGGVDRVAEIDAALAHLDATKRRRSLVDLVIVSVLLDAGAGDAWRYRDARDGRVYARSEGLAIASIDLLRSGALSGDRARPYQAAADALARMTPDQLGSAFHVSADNPLAGLDGRAALLARLGRALAPGGRPSDVVERLLAATAGPAISAAALLRAVLIDLSGIWPARVTLDGVGFGDVWPYFGAAPADWMPFHKLSQWLTYSLIEPIERSGVTVVDVDALTGLPEYRNGGLFLDTGVLELRDPATATGELAAGDPTIVEWRALTVHLLDLVGDRMRQTLGKTARELPLARVLQGGTWAAGREIAARVRPSGAPPLRVASDGQVF